MKKASLITLLLLLVLLPVRAEEAATAAPRKERPKVGLVLSGGGAKGMAHIGALKVLEEAGIPVDIIVGTSIGSIMAGIYALGYTADEMDSLVRAQDWNLLMKDQIARRDVSYSYKEDSDRYILTLPFMNRRGLTEQAEAGRGKRRGVLRNMPSALVEGQNLDQLFTKLSVGYQDNIDFNTLPIPFACVAVDLNTKDEVVFHSGDIVTAIRASMSIPGYFAPVKVGNQFLVDGGMLNNLPVDVCKEMGADYIITVDLHHFKKASEETDQTLPEMVSTMLSIMNGEKYHSGRAASDILIEPNTSQYGVLAFDDKSVDALVDSGLVAAQRVLPQLQSLAEHLKEYPAPAPKPKRRAINLSRDSVRIDQMEIRGTDAKDMSWLLSKTDIAPGETISGPDMDEAMEFFYNTKCFTKASYRVSGTDADGYRLKINFTPQRIHQAGIGFRFDTEEMASILLGVSLNKRKIFGSKLDFETELGLNTQATLRYGYTFHNLTRLNVSAHYRHLGIDFYERQTMLDGSDVKEAYALANTDRYDMFKAQLDYQFTGWHNADITLGVQYNNYRCQVIQAASDNGMSVGAPSSLPYTAYVAKGFADWHFDNLDDNYYPTRGLQTGVSGSAMMSYGYWNFDARLDLKAAISFGDRVTLLPQTYNRWLFKDAFRYQDNFVGGYAYGRYADWHLPFIGINHAFACRDRVDIARLDLRVNLFRQHYLTLLGNYMANWDAESYEGYYGFGASYSINTIIGPVRFLAHWSNLSRKVGVYFSLGFDF